jgi:hypothetical protein
MAAAEQLVHKTLAVVEEVALELLQAAAQAAPVL